VQQTNVRQASLPADASMNPAGLLNLFQL